MNDNSVNVTFKALRDRAFNALDVLADSPPVVEALSELAFVSTMALIQIAQEANEVKYIMSDNSAKIEYMQLKNDMIDIHVALEAAGLPGAINAQSILHRIAILHEASK